MRHRKHHNKLAVDPAHRKSLIRNLCVSMIAHNSIKTTHARAKALRPVFEKLITLAKRDTVANRRLAYSRLNSKWAVKKLFSLIAPEYQDRPGGYTRISKLAEGRVGDNAKMSYLHFVGPMTVPTPQVKE